jgi:hypothetical protein
LTNDTYQLLQTIADLQADGTDLTPAGLFPAFRYQPYWGYHRPDTNGFQTAATVLTLQAVRAQLPLEQQLIIDRISQRAAVAYGLFRNKDGLATYNFWPTTPSRHFPHGLLLHRHNHFRIPDDIDDTALIYLTTDTDTTNLNWLKTKLIQHANGSNRLIQNTFPDWRHLQAYSTWFGKNMPVEFDACALSNLLLLIFRYDLPLNRHDQASLALLRAMIETSRYRTAPFRCAPNYVRTALIGYHLARLMAEADPPVLRPVRTQLIDGLWVELGKSTQKKQQPDRLLLSTALLRLGQRPPKLTLTDPHAGWAEAPFFVAGLLSSYENPFLRSVASHPLTHIRWRCPAHELALAVENLSMNNYQ